MEEPKQQEREMGLYQKKIEYSKVVNGVQWNIEYGFITKNYKTDYVIRIWQEGSSREDGHVCFAIDNYFMVKYLIEFDYIPYLVQTTLC